MATIVQTIESFAYGSAKSVKQLCDLLKKDHQVTVFYGTRDGTATEVTDLDPTIRWVALPGRGPMRHLQNLLFLTRQIDPHTNYIHGHSTFGGMYAKLLGFWFRKAKVFYSPRGYSFLREDFSSLQRRAFWWIEWLTSGWCETVTCGPAEQQLADQLRGQHRNINNGVAIPSDVDLNTIGDEILSVGRISIQKGFDIFKQIATAMPNLSFVWMGSAEPSDAHLLTDLPPNVRLIDYQPHAATMARIRAAKLILLPSRWEGLSRVLLESISFGKAIVTSRCPANIDCLAASETPATHDERPFEYDNGYACAEVTDYIRALTSLCHDADLLRSKQQASYRHAQRHFDSEVIHRQWRELYQDPQLEPAPALAPHLTA